MASRDGVNDENNDDVRPGPSNEGEVNNGNITRIVAGITTDLDFASQLTSLITEQGLLPADAAKVFDTLDPTSLTREITYIKALNEVTKYEGFNPREIIKILLTAHRNKEAAILADPTTIEEVSGVINVNGVDTEFKFNSNQSFTKDMQFICLMFITRGAAYEKIMKKSSEIMKSCMKIMRAKYSINVTVRRPGVSLDAKTVTTPRIAASFPCITVGLFQKGFGRTIFDIDSLFPDVNIPRVLFSPMMSSLLPKNEDAPLAVMLAIAVKVDDILHQIGSKTSLSALYQYLMASYNSTATTERLKIKYCVMWNLGERENGTGPFKYSTGVKLLRAKAKDLIQSFRSTDPELANILSKV